MRFPNGGDKNAQYFKQITPLLDIRAIFDEPRREGEECSSTLNEMRKRRCHFALETLLNRRRRRNGDFELESLKGWWL